MNYLDFTAEETNLIAIYKVGSRLETLAAMIAALPLMEYTMRSIASHSISKLIIMNNREFLETIFAFDDDPENLA